MTNYIFSEYVSEHDMLAKDIISRFGSDANIVFMDLSNLEDKNNKIEVSYKYQDIKFSDKALKKFLANPNTHFFFLSKNADHNVSLAFKLMEKIKELKLPTTQVSIFVYPNWENIESFVVGKQRDMSSHFDIKYVNLIDLYANAFWKKYKPVDFVKFNAETCEAEEDFKMAIVGFNKVTRGAMFKIYTQARFEKSEFGLDVYDVSASAKGESFKKRFPGFAKDITLNFIDLNKFLEAESVIVGNLSKYKLLIVDFGDDLKNCEFLRNIQTVILENDLFDVTVASFVKYPDSDLMDSELYPNILLFGQSETIYNSESIILESFIKSGKLVNDYYNSTKKDSMKIKNWIGMSNFEKGSNISVGDFNYTFVKLIGRENFAKFNSTQDFEQWLLENPKKFDVLARTEHLRWNAYLFSNGWDVMPLESEIMPFNKDESKKLHTCLVPFDELDAVSAMFNEDYKKYDADNVKIVYDIFKLLNK